MKATCFSLCAFVAASVVAGCGGKPTMEPVAVDRTVFEMDAQALDSLGGRLAWDAYYDSAAVIFSRSGELHAAAGDWDKYVAALVNQGANERDGGRYEAGLATIERADSVARVHEVDDEVRANVRLELAYSQIRASRYSVGIATLNALETSLATLGHDSLRCGRLLYARAWANHEQERFLRADSLYREALHGFPVGLRGEFEIAKTLNALANLQSKLGNPKAARIIHEDVLSRRTRILRANHPLLAASQANIALSFWYDGEAEKGISLYLEATQMYRTTFGRSHPEVARCYNNLASFYEQLGDIDRALLFAHQSARIRRMVLPEDHSTNRYMYLTLGRLELQRGSPDAAIPWFKKLAASRNARAYSRTHAHLGLGRAYLALGNRAEARNHFLVALEASRSLTGSPNLEARLDWNSFLSRSQRLPTDSLSTRIGEICDTARSSLGVDHAVTLECMIAWGDHERRASNWKEAVTKFESVLAQVHGIDRRSFQSEQKQIESLHGIGASHWEAFQDTGEIEHLRNAIKFMRASASLALAVRHNFEGLASWRNSIARSESSLRDMIDMDAELYANTDSTAHIASAYQLGRVAKSQLLVDMVQFGEEVGVDSHRRAIDGLALVDEIREDSASFLERISVLDDKVDRLQVTVDRVNKWRARPSAEILGVPPALTPLDFLTSNEVVLDFVHGVKTLAVFVRTSSEIHWLVLNDKVAIDSLATSLRAAIASHSYHDFVPPARALYRQLIEPIEDLIDGKHVTIIPDGILHFVPFEVLLTDDAPDGGDMRSYRALPFFIRNNPISYSYSATLMHQLRTRQRSKPRKEFLGVAPVFRQPLSPGARGGALFSQKADSSVAALRNIHLPASLQEVKRIKSRVQKSLPIPARLFGARSTVLLHEQATESRLKAADLTAYRFVHLATHAFANEANPDLSGLLLAEEDGGEDGVLHLSEVYNLKTNAELVVLSACETGLGKLATGEGIIGLTRGFLYSGAENVMVSLWKADDSTTRDLMVAFYDAMLDGASKAEALQAAKLEIISKSPVHARPFFWGQFVLIGQ